MAMVERAVALENAASFETRQMRVLDGRAARERANARRGDRVKIGVAVLAILVYMLGLTFLSAKITSAGAEINALNEQIATVENDAALADMEIGAKAALERVEAYAISELGMVYPDPGQTYFLSEESSLSIAVGRAALAEARAETEAAEQARPGVLAGAVASIRGLFNGTAQAAEVGAD